MDYKKQMAEAPKKSFNSYYEEVVDNILSISFGVSPKLIGILSDKRKKGLDKYGELSFQNSFENTMSSPTLQHAQEEVLDCINYLSHEVFKSRMWSLPDREEKIRRMLEGSLMVYDDISSLMEEESYG